MRQHTFLILLISLAIQFAGCGGGGGGGAATTTPTTTPPTTTASVVTLATVEGVPNGSLIGDIDFTLNLPTGVTVKATPSQSNPAVMIPDAGVVVLKGTASGATLTATYVPGTPGKVDIKLISATGITPGTTFAVVNCDVAAGASPAPTDYSTTPNIAPTGVFDVNGVALPNTTIAFSVA